MQCTGVRVTVVAFFIKLLFVSETRGSMSQFSDSQWVTCERRKHQARETESAEVKVHFYDFKNNYHIDSPISKARKAIVDYSGFNVYQNLVVYIPDFTSLVDDVITEWMRYAFQTTPNYFVVIDYSAYTSSEYTQLAFERALPYCSYIGRSVGVFLADLTTNAGLPSNNIHIIGHGFGAHIGGYAGDRYHDITTNYLWRLTGIDPLKPCFVDASLEDQISSGKAQYVEVYHCTDAYLGTTNVVADVDFFYNKHSENQPGCFEGVNIKTLGNVSAETCGHAYCVKFFCNTVLRPDLYPACSSFYDHGSVCGSHEAIAGYHNHGEVRGMYYASTNVI